MKLEIGIICGKKTCASEKGKFCKYFGDIHFGQTPVCRLFPNELDAYTELKDEKGWTLRCKECLEGSKEEDDL